MELTLPLKGILFAIFLLAFAHADGNITNEGGNVTYVDVSQPVQTTYWSGLVGWMDNSTSPDFNYPVLIHSPQNSSILTAYPNGSVSNYTLLLARLPYKPNVSALSSPTAWDFNSSGMFSNFSLFAGQDFGNFLDSPIYTFASPLAGLPCRVGDSSFTCAHVLLEQESFLGVLKYSNSTHSEPVFISYIDPRQGYNGSSFDFQFMLPANETYYLYVYPEQELNVTLFSPDSTTYFEPSITLNYSIAPALAVDSCWYVLDSATFPLLNCTSGEQNLAIEDGTHTLALYANASDGSTASASAVFAVQTTSHGEKDGTEVALVEEVELPGGGIPGEKPAPPKAFIISVSPAPLILEPGYLKPAAAAFTIYSSAPAQSIFCVVDSKFKDHVSIRLEASDIPASSAVNGTVYVELPPETLIFSKPAEGRLQCIAAYAPDVIASDVVPIVIVPVPPPIKVDIGNSTIEANSGDQLHVDLNITNLGNSSFTNLSILAKGTYDFIFTVPNAPDNLSAGKSSLLSIGVLIPPIIQPGPYIVIFEVRENQNIVALETTRININPTEKAVLSESPEVGPEEFFVQPPFFCTFPKFFPIYAFSNEAPQWIFMALMFLATWALLNWMNYLPPRMRLAVPILPLLFSIPGIRTFNPCFMMNASVLIFLGLLAFGLLGPAIPLKSISALLKKGAKRSEPSKSGMETKEGGQPANGQGAPHPHAPGSPHGEKLPQKTATKKEKAG
jgi:hypothetical protein